MPYILVILIICLLCGAKIFTGLGLVISLVKTAEVAGGWVLDISSISYNLEHTLCVCLFARRAIHVYTVIFAALPVPGISHTSITLQIVTANSDSVLHW